ncbi:hypothetical protein FHS42_005386 [Streptomyces zagrosensis]|uniref:VOC domain-containing protein n=1 Tax=Streptomyces zagrosensis TaxID=1042984 RepID=A0A7W9V0L2_9ACTN|nr:hypothetical protein [Streptomyces zagrosensis]
MITAFDHVQLAAPPGSEAALRAYYVGILGLTEVPKPPSLAARGGCWFAAGAVCLHLGIDPHFRPAAKAHPGLRVQGIDTYARHLEERGAKVVWDDNLPGHRRFYGEDPVGNRLEFLEPEAAATQPEPARTTFTASDATAPDATARDATASGTLAAPTYGESRARPASEPGAVSELDAASGLDAAGEPGVVGEPGAVREPRN